MIKKFKKEIVLYLAIVLLFTSFFIIKPFQLAIVSGSSMYPTLENGNLVFLTRGKLEKNDVVSFDSTKSWIDNNRGLYIKRILAVPGETISINESNLYVENKKILSFENKIKNEKGNYSYTLKKNEYFLVGDNVGNSIDSLWRLLNNYEDFTVEEEYIYYKTKIEKKDIQ